MIGTALVALGVPLLCLAVTLKAWQVKKEGQEKPEMVSLYDCFTEKCQPKFAPGSEEEKKSNKLFKPVGKMLMVSAFAASLILVLAVFLFYSKHPKRWKGAAWACATATLTVFLALLFLLSRPEGNPVGGFGFPLLFLGCVCGIAGPLFIRAARDQLESAGLPVEQ